MGELSLQIHHPCTRPESAMKFLHGMSAAIGGEIFPLHEMRIFLAEISTYHKQSMYGEILAPNVLCRNVSNNQQGNFPREGCGYSVQK
jgi:hypothetical protein